MDFRGMNRFNVVVNALSGNFLPLSEKKTSIGFVPSLYVIFTWLVEATFILTGIIGLVFFSPTLTALQEGGITTAVFMEMLAVTSYMSSQRDFLRNLIAKINGILVESGNLRTCVSNTTKPHKMRLKIWTIWGVTSVILWTLIPLVKVFDTKSFTHGDYTMPAYFAEAPYDIKIFLAGILVQMMGVTYLFLKKTAVDVYVSYFVTVLTAEYIYVGEQLTEVLRQENEEKNELLVIEDLRKCVQQHIIVMETAQLLSKLLSVNVSAIYLSCILRFCFLTFNIITLDDYFERLVFVVYSIGSFGQVYMLCACVQELLEAVMSMQCYTNDNQFKKFCKNISAYVDSEIFQTQSTSITDNAFYENWYARGHRIKNIFRTIGLGDEIECRVSAFGIIDLTVPTFLSIVNKAYSVCLLVLRI